MPFGPVNGPVIFIVFIHDLNSSWQDLAHTRGIIFDAKTGSTIIVDDIFSWAPTFEEAIAYMLYVMPISSLPSPKSFIVTPDMPFHTCSYGVCWY